MNTVPTGYKQTDIGVIPEDWEIAPLAGLINILHGFGFQSQYFKSFGQYLLTTPGHFHEIGGFRDIGEKQKFYDGKLPDGYLLNEGDLIVAMTEQADGLLGSAALVPAGGNYLHNQRLGKVKILSDNVNIGFIYRLFNSKKYRNKVRETAVGTKVKHTSPSKLLEIIVAFPPNKAEQQAIATALSNTDALIESLEKLIDKKRQIKQGAMQELLTPKEGWEIKKLGDVGKCHRGVSYNPDRDLHSHDKDNTVRLLRSNNIQNGNLDLNGLQFVDSERVKENQILQERDIVICMANGSKQLVGKSAVFTNKNNNIRYTFGAFMGCFRTDESFASSGYIAANFQSFQYRSYIDILLSGSSINNLNPSNIESILIPFPPLEEQTAIAIILSDMDEEITALEARLEKTRTLKSGMMHELLTGRIRLI